VPRPAGHAVTRRPRLTARRRSVLLAVVRPLLGTTAMTTLYYVLPFDRELTTATAPLLAAGLLAVVVLLAWQTRQIVRSTHPRIRAVEALATTLSLFLLVFATVYHLMERHRPDSFATPLTRTDALYFAVTVFATVGFGDITAHTQTARIVTTLQMVGDLLLVGVGVRIIAAAVEVGVRRGGGEPLPRRRP
jgi:glucan phosphoethanolaminetransferase (alkaline phosphatase superfamily)